MNFLDSDFVFDIYVRELLNQARTAVVALADLQETLQDRDQNELFRRAFMAAHTYVSAACSISKLLWADSPQRTNRQQPSKEGSELLQISQERAKRLRLAMKVKGGSPLQRRAVRNGFEHFDSRLDKFLKDSWEEQRQGRPMVVINHAIADKSMPMVVVVGAESPIALKHIDQKAMTISVLNDEVSLAELHPAILRILTNAEAFLNR